MKLEKNTMKKMAEELDTIDAYEKMKKMKN